MPPKKAAAASKADQAKKQKVVEDKTFGFKNKNKSKAVQKYVQQISQSGQAKPDPVKLAAKKKKEEAAAREELNDLFMVAVSQPKVPVGVDPKSILCEFFKAGQCQKGFKCKFSHDLNVQRKGEKIDIYSDKRDGEEDTMDDWDQETLEKVIQSKNAEYQQNKPTDIPGRTESFPSQPGRTAGMPPPSKRAKLAEPPSDDEERPGSDSSRSDGNSDNDSSSSDGEDASQEMETVQADFAFFDPKPSDFHGVRLLLKTYLDSKPWDLTGFVDLVLEQTTVGTVVKMAEDEDEEGEGNGGDGDGDDDLFGLITVLNLGRYGENRCFKDLKDYLLGVCGDKDTKKKLKSLLEEKASTVGLLVCRRFVNFPYEMVPKMYDSLFDEVSWATEDEPTQELQDSFRFKQYLLVVRIFERKTTPKQKARNNKDDDEPVIYPKLEDEIFRELSSWSFTFPIRAEQSTQQELKNYRELGLVMCVKAEAIPKFRKKLEALIS